MKIIKLMHGNQLYLFLEGRLDAAAVPDLEQVWHGSLERVAELIVDLEKLEYLSMAGVGVLLEAQEIMNRQGSMKMIHMNEMIKEIFNTALHLLQTNISS